ncbi:MAG: helix-turn-helix domain-containing protein [Bacteroidales bacterium]|nr:helix-turn-helix domain-containing protein [Candidatus Cacconaster equi]
MAQIKSKEQYDAIMARIDELFFATDENTPKDDKRLLELDVLSAMVEEYEQEHFPIQTPSLSSTIVARMNERNYSQKELASLLGISAPRLCDIIGGKKTPTYNQARTISKKLDIDPVIVLAL